MDRMHCSSTRAQDNACVSTSSLVLLHTRTKSSHQSLTPEPPTRASHHSLATRERPRHGGKGWAWWVGEHATCAVIEGEAWFAVLRVQSAVQSKVKHH
mmetsp:Transcript_3184/g.6472  ORF Transcript_3184/g.6472 Transcript_3184/m.6472 type:complete len:98 (-) Transcript_3184:1323-1616(-)